MRVFGSVIIGFIGVVLILCGIFTPLFGQWLAMTGPDWIKGADSMGLFVTCFLLFITLMFSGGFCLFTAGEGMKGK